MTFLKFMKNDGDEDGGYKTYPFIGISIFFKMDPLMCNFVRFLKVSSTFFRDTVLSFFSYTKCVIALKF